MSGAAPHGKAFDLAVFGGRGAGAVAAMVFHRAAAAATGRFVGFLNDVEPAGSTIGGHPVLGPFSGWTDLPAATRFLAPLHKVQQMPARAGIVRKLGVPRERWANLIDPQAIIADDARCGAGLFMCGLAHISCAATVGDHVAVRGGGQISHDCTVEDFGFVGVNAVVCGYCTMREGAYVAPGALVREGLTIGRYAVVGLGAVVLKDVPDGAVVAGNPAEIVGECRMA